MDGEKGVETKNTSKDTGKQAELAFKLYDKVPPKAGDLRPNG